MLSDPEFRELVTLPLPASALRELTKAGYTNVGEVSGLTVEQVASILLVHCSFDDLMDGGFPCGRISELCGQPGVGKTQFCLQSCLTVQVPQWCGGLGGEAIFLDTEGNFMPKRLRQMAVDLVEHFNSNIVPHLHKHINSLGNSSEDLEEKMACKEVLSNLPTEESLLSKVHYIRCTDYLQLLAAVRRLNEFCKYHPNASVQCTRLVVVDSIALPFRYEFDDIPQRNRLLASLSQSLLLIAGSQNAAVFYV
ncbi:unnamed protein product [Rodentolepis nana]|uniref:DNA repair protein RAD51 homolog 3 n=1 Tax=Rodentolepis nana TaxID=102285 RepID=A0A0R3TAP3_RODNA|nr:unnamed protein product [Rodentolepis nana]